MHIDSGKTNGKNNGSQKKSQTIKCPACGADVERLDAHFFYENTYDPVTGMVNVPFDPWVCRIGNLAVPEKIAKEFAILLTIILGIGIIVAGIFRLLFF